MLFLATHDVQKKLTQRVAALSPNIPTVCSIVDVCITWGIACDLRGALLDLP